MISSRSTGLALVVALASVASLAPTSSRAAASCRSFADAEGDAAPLARSKLNDAALDITNVRYGVADGKFRVLITVGKYADRPMLGWGYAFQSGFLARGSGRDVLFGYASSPSRDVDSMFVTYAWIRVNGKFVTDSDRALQATVDGNVVTLTFRLAFLEKHAGPLAGQVVVPASTQTYAVPGPYGRTYDEAVPPGGLEFTVAPCG